MEVVIDRIIVPNRLIFKKQCKKIIEVDEKFIINEYKLYFTTSSELEKVTICSFHPNCDPHNGELCLPRSLGMKRADNTIVLLVENLLRTFNLDDCYFQPWSEFYCEGG